MSNNLAQQRAASLETVKAIVNALDDKKAGDIRIIDVSGNSSITDFFVVATGSSDPHLRAMRIELEKVLDDARVKIVGVESQNESGWTVVDAFDVIVHIFRADQRANFALEKMFAENKGVELPAAKFIKPVAKPEGFVSVSGNTKSAAKPAKRPVAAKKPVAKTKAPVVKKSIVAKTVAAKVAKSQKPKAAKTVVKAESKAPAKKGVVSKGKPVSAKAAPKPAPKAAAKASPVKKAAPAKATPAKRPVAKKPVAKAGVVTRAKKK